MAINVSLTPEQERVIESELRSGRYRTVEQVIGEALEALRQRESSSSATTSNESEKEAVRKLLEFATNNRVHLEGVTVKELIHEGHRL